jgi:hypothetical protein
MVALMGNGVEAWLDSLSPVDRDAIELLRRIVITASAGLTETIKWNAPSFADGDQDRVTLGVERRGGVRMILHRGATVQDAAAFVFDDPEGIARWPSPDRGVVILKTPAEVDERGPALGRLVARWIEANRQA